MAEGQQQRMDTVLKQILLSRLHNNWMGLIGVLRSTAQKWPELRLNPATESGTQWEQRDIFHTVGSPEYC